LDRGGSAITRKIKTCKGKLGKGIFRDLGWVDQFMSDQARYPNARKKREGVNTASLAVNVMGGGVLVWLGFFYESAGGRSIKRNRNFGLREAPSCRWKVLKKGVLTLHATENEREASCIGCSWDDSERSTQTVEKLSLFVTKSPVRRGGRSRKRERKKGKNYLSGKGSSLSGRSKDGIQRQRPSCRRA